MAVRIDITLFRNMALQRSRRNLSSKVAILISTYICYVNVISIEIFVSD